MPTETAADLASMFATDEFAEAAAYLGPEAEAVSQDCSVILDRGRGREMFDAGSKDMVGSERHAWLQRSEVDQVKRGGVLTILDADGLPTDEVYTITDLPKQDQTAVLWSAQLIITE